MKNFIQSTYPFLLQTVSLPTQPPLISHVLSWKSKHKHAGVDITSFFQDTKSSLTKSEKCLLEAPYGNIQTSKLVFFTKNVNHLYQKTIFAKISTLDV